jgi:hypothetical protein
VRPCLQTIGRTAAMSCQQRSSDSISQQGIVRAAQWSIG